MSGSEERGVLVRASDRAWRILVLLALGAVLVVVGVELSAVVVPSLLAMVIIPVGRPPFRWLNRWLPASASSALVLLGALAALVAAAWLMVSSIAANWTAMTDGISQAFESILEWTDQRMRALSEDQIATMQENLEDLVTTIANVLVGGVTRSVAVIGSFFVGLSLFMVTLFFGVRDWPKFREWIVVNAQPDSRPNVELFAHRFDTLMRSYWKSQALVGVFDGVVIAAGLWIIGVPLALPIGVLTFVISFVPYVGAIISSVLAVLVALGTGDGGDALWTLLLCLLVFNTGENLMRPLLYAGGVEMPTFVAFIAITVGVFVAGALGAILAVPLVALVSEARRIFLPRDGEEPVLDQDAETA